jgi:hypothetical protein
VPVVLPSLETQSGMRKGSNNIFSRLASVFGAVLHSKYVLIAVKQCQCDDMRADMRTLDRCDQEIPVDECWRKG